MNRSYPRVVFDTNVLIQAFLRPVGLSGRCFNAARERRIQMFISKRTISEVEDVIERPSIRSLMPANPGEQIKRFLSELKSVAYHAKEMTGIFRLDRDPKDEIIIELAVDCDADYIVSWDRDLLDLMTGIDAESKQFRQRFRGLKIVKPDEFLRVVDQMSISLKP